MILFVASKKDPAGLNITNMLLSRGYFEQTSERISGNPVFTKRLASDERAKLILVEEDAINTQNSIPLEDARLVIFLSRHSSRSGKSTLSVHTPGNMGQALMGGLSRTVSISPASAMKDALAALYNAKEEKRLNYEVSYECTHHGPSLTKPAMFVEVGSSLEHWQDNEAAECVVEGSIAAASNSESYPTSLGIGGPHYNRKFTNLALTTEKAFGHIVPKYNICSIDARLLEQCIERTVEPVTDVVLDWKGIRGKDRSPLLRMLNELDLDIEKI